MTSNHLLRVPEGRQMQIIKPGQLLWVENETGNAQLLDWKGQPLHTFGTKQELKHYLLPGGRALVADNQKTVIVSPEGKVEKVVPAAYKHKYKEPVFENKYFHATDAAGKICWVGIRDGRVFRE